MAVGSSPKNVQHYIFWSSVPHIVESGRVRGFAAAAVISGLVGFGAVVLGHRLGLEYAGRLLAMTFILVVIGADGRAGKHLLLC